MSAASDRRAMSRSLERMSGSIAETQDTTGSEATQEAATMEALQEDTMEATKEAIQEATY